MLREERGNGVMSESKDVLIEAGRILRQHCESDEAVAALVIAASTFVSFATEDKRDDSCASEPNAERFKRILQEAAALLSPVCPHCGKELHASAQQHDGDA